MNSKLIKNGYNWALIGVIIQVILSFVVIFTLQFIIGAYIGATSGITDGDALTEKITSLLRDKGIIFNAIAYIIANSCAVFIAMAIARRKGAYKNWFSKSKINAGFTALLCVGTIGLSLIGGMIINFYHIFFDNSGVTESISTSLFSDDKIVLVVTILYVCIIGPFLEEFLFRGFVLHETASVSPLLGMVVSSVLFGLFHGNFEQAINATLLGMLLSYVTLKSNSIWPAVFMHITNNSFSCFMSWVSEKLPEDTANTVSGVLVLLIVAVSIVTAVLIVKKLGKINRNEDILDRKNFITDEKIAAIKEKEGKTSLGAKLFFASPVTYIVFLIMFGFCLFTTMAT